MTAPFFKTVSYSLGAGEVHMPPIKPIRIAKINTIPIGSDGIKDEVTYSVLLCFQQKVEEPH